MGARDVRSSTSGERREPLKPASFSELLQQMARDVRSSTSGERREPLKPASSRPPSPSDHVYGHDFLRPSCPPPLTPSQSDLPRGASPETGAYVSRPTSPSREF